MKKLLLYIFVFISFIKTNAQCPTISLSSTVANITCGGGAINFTANSNFGPNLEINWYGPGGAPLVTYEYGTNPVYSTFTLATAGIYTVTSKVITGTCVVTRTVQVTSSIGVPYFELSAPTYTACSGQTVQVKSVSVTTSPVPNVATNYTMGTTYPPTTYSVAQSFNVPCGNYWYTVMDITNSCISGMNVKIACNTLTPLPINIGASSNSICVGSSVTFSASGANTYTWSNNSNAATFSLFPSANTSYSLIATDANNCISTGVAAVTVNTTCATVWPGDANSDGLVNSLDLFELGYQFAFTGPARTATSNVFSAKDAAIWTGTVSTGKNLAHADCDGDGIVGASDTLAIYNNFLQTHALKNLSANSVTPQITIVPDQPNAYLNSWNTLGIYLGDGSNPINNIYGVAYEVLYDTALVSANQIYIKYTNSFLNPANNNVNLSKAIANNERVYSATSRTSGGNVSGASRIATLYFKPKATAAANSTLDLVIMNAQSTNNSAVLGSLTTGSVSVILQQDVGLKESSKNDLFKVYPNPANDHILIVGHNERSSTLSIHDLSGRLVVESTILGNKKMDVSSLKTGIYIISLKNGTHTQQQKLIISR